MMFLDCPAYLDHERTVRCGLPAEIRCRFTMRSTDGPLESAMIRCPAGHHFNGAIESLTWDRQDHHDPRPAGTGRDSLRRGHDGRNGDGGSGPRVLPTEPERKVRRPNGAPAYYLGRPAALWMAAARPRRRPAPCGQSAATVSAADSPLRTAPSM
jgi:hypothetical protein